MDQKHQLKAQAKQMFRLFLAIFFGIALLTGCGLLFDVLEYVTAENFENVFVFPLEGDTGKQAKFQSQEFLQQAKVASKRIQITRRWVQEGRFGKVGRYIPTVAVVKVNRTPVTREWRQPETGKPSDTAIWQNRVIRLG